MIGTPGLCRRDAPSSDSGAVPYIFFGVDDMDAALDRVRELGGSVDEPELGDETSAGEYGSRQTSARTTKARHSDSTNLTGPGH